MLCWLNKTSLILICNRDHSSGTSNSKVHQACQEIHLHIASLDSELTSGSCITNSFGFLLESSAALSTADTTDFTSLVSQLETLKNGWLNEPSPEFDGHVPAIIIDNERRRMPEAMGGRRWWSMKTVRFAK
jgi:hypothetical protein